ncbi:TPR-like protein [Clavulina sp. PMI_390]|nr:TPR-like protein [Clavulina sp. PMI_390]
MLPPSIIRRPKLGEPFCDAGDFAAWYISNIFEIDQISVGRLQEIYLFRSKKAPFHHEFLVAGFRNDGDEITSWIRLERGAQMQHGSSGPITGVHSSGPMTGGVTARETVSFSTTQATLSVNANELAKVILTAPTTHPIFIGAIITQVQFTSNSNDKYQLFTTNCRWYSRRGFLNILQWCRFAQIPATFMWKGAETTLEHLQGKLEKERFGGSKLVDLRAKGLDHRNLLALTADQQNSVPLSRMVLDPFLDSLATAPLDPDERPVLIADLLTKRSHVVSGEDLPQALEDARRAVKLMRDLPENNVNRNDQLAWSLNALASALHLDGRFEEAIPLLQESLELNPSSASFDGRLYELGLNYKRVGRVSEAIIAFRESANLLARREQSLSWSYSGEKQIDALVILAKTLEALGREKEALSVREEVVSIRRDLLARDEDGDDLLIIALINLATCAMSAEEYATSLKASKEALQLCKANTGNERLLPISLALNARVRYCLDDVKSAIQDITTAIELEPLNASGNPTIAHGIWLNMRSTFFLDSGDVLHGLEDIEAATSIYESTNSVFPENPHIVSQLWILHYTRANLLESLESSDEAADAFHRAADILGVALKIEADGPEERFLELFLALEACVQALRELDCLNEARVCAEESINRLRLRRESSISSTLITEALRLVLLRHSKLMAELGDRQEALSLTTEAAEICQETGVTEHQIEALLHRLLQEVLIGHPERAITTAENCRDLCENRLPERLDIRINTLTSYARALNEVGRHADAAEKQEESVALFREVNDMGTSEARGSLALRLGKLSEYYQEARLFSQALVSVDDALENYQGLYAEADDDGLAYCQTLARKASILFSLNEPSKAQHVLDKELELLKIVLEDMSAIDILEQADRHYREALTLTVKGKSSDALDSARQYVVLTRLACSIDPGYKTANKSETGEESGNGDAKPKGVLEEALIALRMIATMNNSRIDAVTAMLEASKLSNNVDSDIDEVVMQNALQDRTEENQPGLT